MTTPDAHPTLLRALLAALAAAARVTIAARPPVVARAAQAGANTAVNTALYQALHWRSIGPSRGGRVTAVTGVRTQPCTFYLGGQAAAFGRPRTAASADASERRPDAHAVDWRHRGRRLRPEHRLRRHGEPAIRNNVILGLGMSKSTDAGKTWRLVGLEGAGQFGTVRVHPTNPDVAYAAALGDPFATGPDRGVFRTKDGGRPGRRCSSSTTRRASCRWRWTGRTRTALRRRVARPAQALDDHQRRPGGHRRHLQVDRRRRPLDAPHRRPAEGPDRQGVARRRAVEPERRLRHGRGARRRGRPVPLVGRGRDLDARQQQQRLRARPFYFDYVYANPKNENEVWV